MKGWWFPSTDFLVSSLPQDLEVNVFSTGNKHLDFTVLNTAKREQYFLKTKM